MTMLYFGPEVIMPLSSAVAAVAGVLLIFWHRLIGYGRRAVQGVRALWSKLPF